MKPLKDLQKSASNLSQNYVNERSNSSFFSKLTQDASRTSDIEFIKTVSQTSSTVNVWKTVGTSKHQHNEYLAGAVTGSFLLVLNQIQEGYKLLDSKNSALVRTIEGAIDYEHMSNDDKKDALDCLKAFVVKQFSETQAHPKKSNEDLLKEIDSQLQAVEKQQTLNV